jgi:DNA-binding transcriptional LysR family regulator
LNIDLIDESPVNLNRMDLNLLVALDALLTEANVTRAAARTAVGQSAMSASLARLRLLFGDPILVRQGQTMVLTPFAEALKAPVRAAVTSVDAVFTRRPAFDHRTDPAIFKIMATDYVTIVLLRPMLALLETIAPNIHIVVKPFEQTYATALRRGDVDMVVMPAELLDQDDGFESEELFSDRYALVIDKSHPWVRDTITMDELLALKFVAYHSGAVHPILDADLDRQGVKLTVAVTTGAFVVAPFLVSGTNLASITLERLADQLVEPAGLRIVELPLQIRTIHQRSLWNASHNDDLAHAWLRETILHFGASLPLQTD